MRGWTGGAGSGRRPRRVFEQGCTTQFAVVARTQGGLGAIAGEQQGAGPSVTLQTVRAWVLIGTGGLRSPYARCTACGRAAAPGGCMRCRSIPHVVNGLECPRRPLLRASVCSMVSQRCEHQRDRASGALLPLSVLLSIGETPLGLIIRDACAQYKKVAALSGTDTISAISFP